MKHSVLAKIGGITAALLWVGGVFGSDGPQSTEATGAAIDAQETARPVAGVKTAYGVDDVVKLTRAQVSEDIIATYIQTSGSVYNLKPSDILELHRQGVSDKIVTLMLSQGHVAGPNTNQPVLVMTPMQGDPAAGFAPGAAVPQSTVEANSLFIPGQNAFEIAAAGAPAMVEPASTLYVIPDYRSYGGYRPVYTVYGGACYTSASYGCAPSVIRVGGSFHHYHSFHHR